MNLLIVDGNEKEASDRYLERGMDTQYEVYSKILQKLSNNNLNITILHPAIKSDYIPLGLNIGDFHGVVWTGSLLNIYDKTQSITRQIELAKNLFNKKNKIFGSCWGLHVLVTAAGGKVRKNPNGLEAIIAKNINLNEIGPKIEQHHFFPNKTNVEFIEVVNSNTIKMKVWERGAGVTLACGSGACAAVYAGWKKKLIEKNSQVQLEKGSLNINIDADEAIMTGPAENSYNGYIEI